MLTQLNPERKMLQVSVYLMAALAFCKTENTHYIYITNVPEEEHFDDFTNIQISLENSFSQNLDEDICIWYEESPEDCFRLRRNRW